MIYSFINLFSVITAKVLMKDIVIHEDNIKSLTTLHSDTCIVRNRNVWIHYDDIEVSLISLPDYNFSKEVKIRNVFHDIRMC